MKKFFGSRSVALVCMIIGFMLAVQFRHVQDAKSTVPNQRVDKFKSQLELQGGGGVKKFFGSRSVALVCMIIGFMLAVQFRHVQDVKSTVPNQRVDKFKSQLELQEATA